MRRTLFQTWVTQAPDASGYVPDCFSSVASANWFNFCCAWFSSTPNDLHQNLVQALTNHAARARMGESNEAILAVGVPVSPGMTKEMIVHRAIRRLYLTAAAAGLGEMAGLRDFVQQLRLSYLQTRGSLDLSHSRQSATRSGAVLHPKVGFDQSGLTVELGHAGATEEITIAEGIVARMGRLDFYEAEDQLAHDLSTFKQVGEAIGAYRAAVNNSANGLLAAEDAPRAYFQAMWRRVKNPDRLRVRPLLVFEAASPIVCARILDFFGEARALLASHGTAIAVVGDRLAGTLFQAASTQSLIAPFSIWVDPPVAHLGPAPLPSVDDWGKLNGPPSPWVLQLFAGIRAGDPPHDGE